MRLKEGFGRESLAFTPDGRYLLYVKMAGPDSGELFRVPVEGGAPEALGLTGRGLSLVSVHPEGARITYTLGQYFEVNLWTLENFL